MRVCIFSKRGGAFVRVHGCITQFERSCQAPDDGDGIGGVCAELVQRWKEGVPLVLQLWDGDE